MSWTQANCMKYKHIRERKSGVKKYVYYKYSRYGGKLQCNELYIREEDLIDRISEYIDAYRDIDIKVNSKIIQQIQMLNEINKIAGIRTVLEPIDYIKQVLVNGSGRQKAQLLKCIDKKFFLQNGEIFLGKNEEK